jgi:hypothetical protein
VVKNVLRLIDRSESLKLASHGQFVSLRSDGESFARARKSNSLASAKQHTYYM